MLKGMSSNEISYAKMHTSELEKLFSEDFEKLDEQ